MRLKSILVLAITILSSCQTQAASVSKLFDDWNQKLVYLFGVEWPDLSESQAAAAWAGWTVGLTVGSVTSLTSNMPWDSCLQDVSAIIVNCYSIYVYIYRNVVTDEPAYAIYATSYGIALIGKVAYVRCGENAVTLDQALLNGDPSLKPGALTAEQQIDAVNQNANFTDSSLDSGTNSTSTSTSTAAAYDPWASSDPWAYKAFDPKPINR